MRATVLSNPNGPGVADALREGKTLDASDFVNSILTQIYNKLLPADRQKLEAQVDNSRCHIAKVAHGFSLGKSSPRQIRTILGI
jgi:hypothetical protein